ncbi:MAG: LacI family DNA-binding transcriptional regulator [Armatimonadetes bacterium]|nr:LacI family DNA-binding transcriptional regulator [Armatimonadota bacterium]
MAQRIRIADVAKRAGMSASTVSYVLNEREGVAISAETRARVLAAANELGYVANPVARALRTGRTNTVGLSVAELTQPFSVVLLTHLANIVEESGWSTMLRQCGPEPVSLVGLRDSLAMWPVDGVIAQTTPVWVQTFRAVNEARRLPFVRLDSQPPNDSGDYVSYELTPGAVAACRHLVEVGCRRIAFVAPDYGIGPECRRQGAYLSVLAEAGLPTATIATEVNTCGAAFDAVRQRLAGGERYDGFACYNDDFAIGVIRALADVGLRVPRDAAVVGFDGLGLGDYTAPRLSSVRIPIEEVATTAWNFLRARLDGSDAPQQGRTFGSELVVRESTRLGADL